MNRKKDRGWTISPDFNPESTGWRYSSEVSVLKLIRELLQQFTEYCPDPDNPRQFVAALCFDAISWWQLFEELKRASTFDSIDRQRFIDFVDRAELYGYPCVMQGIQGIGLVLYPSLAPVLLHQQMMHEQSGEQSPAYGDIRGKNKESKEEVPDKKDLH